MIAQQYDGVHFQVVTMNMKDGSVQGHAHGCADLKRGKAKFAEPQQANDFMDVLSKHDAWLDYNCDFLPECYNHDNCDEAAGRCDNAYDIHWLPCADAIPAFTEAPAEEAPAPAAPVVVVRKGTKRTLITVNGEEVAYVLNSIADSVEAVVRAGL